MKRLFLILCLIAPSLVFAQSWPVHENTYVNDYAHIIDEDAETRIRRNLEVLRDETGVEATVLTMHSRGGFESAGSMESFATGLFNHWGIGDANRNDGILIMVLSADREMRIELGSGYPKGFDREAKDIIDRIFIPAFKNDTMSEGIEDGTDAALRRIARVHAAGEAPPERSGGGIPGRWLFGMFGAAFAGFIAWKGFGRQIRNRFTSCPQCGRRGIHSEHVTLETATRDTAGRGKENRSCRHCDWRDTNTYSIARIRRSTSSSGGSFGGGSSSGGGASGRW